MTIAKLSKKLKRLILIFDLVDKKTSFIDKNHSTQRNSINHPS